MSLAYTIWPNGEACVYRQTRLKSNPVPRRSPEEKEAHERRVRLKYGEDRLSESALLLLGLSNLRNFSNFTLALLTTTATVARVPIRCSLEDFQRRNGRKGITRYGERMVRNSCHVLEQSVRKQHLSFCTATLPSVKDHVCKAICKEWQVVVDSYIRAIRRRLNDKGVSDNLVYVSEIQGERYEVSAFPPLHLHTVFIGRKKGFRGWVISPKVHDRIWLAALRAGYRAQGNRSVAQSRRAIPKTCVKSSCRIEQVRQSASAYLGKYMSKAIDDAEACIKRGHGDMLPRQWWGCSRSLSREVKRQQVCGSENAADLFYVAADFKGSGPWQWCGHFSIGDEVKTRLAVFGKLLPGVVQFYREAAALRRGVSPPIVDLGLCGTIPYKALC